ncbi:hypothetical protein O181_011631 [Austropuccinia psidii MF-1]|uniref:Uncharacterized protein n=1 Tax=Austropuccinia psidii MF-1 TaxID=1389203 RepID=A0A9Q3BT50_9BASI|nr:hypothetical protein [Austropuccinia psidii MF-1]
MKAYSSQCRWVSTNPSRAEAWWDKKQLDNLVQRRTQARREKLKHQTIKTRREYYHHQQLFKQKVWELKSSHWRKFLAEGGPDHAYQAYIFTKDKLDTIAASSKTRGMN